MKITRRRWLSAGAVLAVQACVPRNPLTLDDDECVGGIDSVGVGYGIEDCMLAEIMAQTDRAERLLERCQQAVARTRGLRSGDPVFTPLIAFAEFGQGAAPSVNLIFNVPADADFWAYRLLFYPYCKVVDPVNLTPDEIVYRSTSFVGESFSTGVGTPATAWSDFNNLIDGTFAIMSEGEELQNIDIPVAGAYCANIGKWMPTAGDPSFSTFFGGQWGAASQTPGGYVFDIPQFIARGKALSVRFTPTYLGVRTITDTITGPTTITRQHKYKIVAVLEGEKKVSAFR